MSTAQHLWLGGWASVLVGLCSGALLGLGFHRDGFLGGYGSLRRRLVRLGHIALIMLGVLQMLAALSPAALEDGSLATACWVAWRAGSVAMPAICFLSAWRPGFRHLFAIPVTLLVGAAALTLALTLRALGR